VITGASIGANDCITVEIGDCVVFAFVVDSVSFKFDKNNIANDRK